MSTAPLSTTEEQPPPRFTDSDQCKSFRFCRTCRDTGSRGRLWRRVVAQRYLTNGIDWDCPHGWKWGGAPGLGLWLKQKLSLGSKVSRSTSAVGIRPCGGCARRAARMDGRNA